MCTEVELEVESTGESMDVTDVHVEEGKDSVIFVGMRKNQELEATMCTEVEVEVENTGGSMDVTDIHKEEGEDSVIFVGMRKKQEGKTRVIFVGMRKNQGFLKLFAHLKPTEDLQQASIVIVPTDKEFLASRHHKDLFMALVGRHKMVISSNWVNDSVQIGCLQDKEQYIVKGTDLGMFSKTETYRYFKYQIGHGTFKDISVDEVRHLLNEMGGDEQLLKTEDTIYICADDELQSSDSCVHKEWIFQCIDRCVSF